MTEKWIKKICNTHTHTMEYHSAIRKNEIMPSAATEIDPKDYHTK